MRRLNLIVLLLFFWFFTGCEQEISVKQSGLTAINPVSYTDVAFKGIRDTVLISTFDGRISEIINGANKGEERLILNVGDEIYSIAYDHERKQIYAVTLNSGILIIDESEGRIIKTLENKAKWSYYIYFDPEQDILATSDYADNTYVWDVKNDFVALEVPDAFKGMSPKGITNESMLYFDGNNQIGKWDLSKKDITSGFRLGGRLTDMDKNGNLLLFSHDKFSVYDTKRDSLLYENKHPDWPIYVRSRDTIFRAPVSLALTDGIISENHIFTSGIDRSIRMWKKDSGTLIEDLLGHRATISAMALSGDGKQLVSVDLKGGIKFWQIEKN